MKKIIQALLLSSLLLLLSSSSKCTDNNTKRVKENSKEYKQLPPELINYSATILVDCISHLSQLKNIGGNFLNDEIFNKTDSAQLILDKFNSFIDSLPRETKKSVVSQIDNWCSLDILLKNFQNSYNLSGEFMDEALWSCPSLKPLYKKYLPNIEVEGSITETQLISVYYDILNFYSCSNNATRQEVLLEVIKQFNEQND